MASAARDAGRANAGPLILPLGSPAATLATVGGKGASLARMAAAGLPVPDGFHVCTSAYDRFVHEGGLQSVLEAGARAMATASAADAAEHAAAMRLAFDGRPIPAAIQDAIVAAYAALPGDAPAVAVRSSATAEDLPTLSFAGQQETYLNVRGQDALLAAVRGCWASLWTPRASAYRARNGVPAAGVSMAVVVQTLVPSDAAGILFTANPLGGRRDQAIINAAWGLGAAVVGGLVTPDSLVVDRASGEVLARQTGAKMVMTVQVEGGTEEQPVPADRRLAPVLDDAAVAELVALAGEIESLFGQPQDIEWARIDGRFAILQSRPITTLPNPSPAGLEPMPDVAPTVHWEPPIPGSAWIRRQVVEHMPEPLTPLFAELYLEVGLDRSIDVLMEFMRVDRAIIERLMPRPLFATVNGFAYMRADYRLGARNVLAILKIYVTAVPRMVRTWLPYWRDRELPEYLATIDRWRIPDLAAVEDERLLDGIRELAVADAVYWFAANFPLAISKVTDGLLDRFLRSIRPRDHGADPNGHSDDVARCDDESDGVEGPRTSGPLLRGFPSKTLDAQVALEAIARQIAADAPLRARVLANPARHLLSVLEAEPSGEPVLAAIADYLAHYGHQIYTLDFAAPTQAEDPLPVLLGLRALVEHPERDARAMQAAFVAERERLAEETLRRLNPIQRPIFRRLLAWAQRYTPYREEAIYHVGAAWPTLRRLALEIGRRLVEAGVLDEPEAVFYLRSGELRDACRARTTAKAEGQAATPLHGDWVHRARERHALRERRLRFTPPPTVPADYRFQFGPFDLSGFEPKKNVAMGTALQGFAVSPGRVTAPASVVLSPADFERMEPDTILVCPTTTPAWTPLFAQAAGLVTDIGGVLAHGSIVAREYGIPAVMGTTVATSRIRDGQVLTVDGTSGTVEIHASGPLLATPSAT